MAREEIKRVIGYVRVSTAEQGRSGLGLEDQRAAIHAECERKGWDLVSIYQDVSSGRNLNRRHERHRALEALANRHADALVTAKFDRLSRSTIDLAKVLKVSVRHGWAVVVLDMDLDTSTASGRLMARQLMSVAEFESDRISERVKEALAAKKARNEPLGGARLIAPDVEATIVRRRRAGLSLQRIAAELNSGGIPPPRSEVWSWTTVQRVVRRNVDEPVRTRSRRVGLD